MRSWERCVRWCQKGQAERHGSILKLMVMKMAKGHNLAGLDEVRVAGCALW